MSRMAGLGLAVRVRMQEAWGRVEAGAGIVGMTEALFLTTVSKERPGEENTLRLHDCTTRC